MSEELPLILSDGTNSYIYGPDGLPVEQISSGGTVTYLHHDQAGSTRLLTGSTGTVTGKCTYGAYGAPTCEGAATTPLGYDGQYTSSDTGLIYLRTRVYDPATAQFLTIDPIASLTRAPYYYAGDNPLNKADLTGLVALSHPGFDGDFDARFLLAEGEVSEHAKSEEVFTGAAGARDAPRVRVWAPIAHVARDLGIGLRRCANTCGRSKLMRASARTF